MWGVRLVVAHEEKKRILTILCTLNETHGSIGVLLRQESEVGGLLDNDIIEEQRATDVMKGINPTVTAA